MCAVCTAPGGKLEAWDPETDYSATLIQASWIISESSSKTLTVNPLANHLALLYVSALPFCLHSSYYGNSHSFSSITRLSNLDQLQSCIHKHCFKKDIRTFFFIWNCNMNWHPDYQSLQKEQCEAKQTYTKTCMACHHRIKVLLSNKPTGNLSNNGNSFCKGCNLYSLFLQHFQLNAWATGSLATDSAMMQDWRGTALQFHSAGEDKSANVSCCSSSKPLQVTVIKPTASHLTARKSTRTHIKANARDTKICYAFWHMVYASKYQFNAILQTHNVKVYPNQVNNVLNRLMNKRLRGGYFAFLRLFCCSAVDF